MNYCFFPSWFGSQSHLIWEVVSFSIVAWSLPLVCFLPFFFFIFSFLVWCDQNEGLSDRNHTLQTCLSWQGDNIELSTHQNPLLRSCTVCCSGAEAVYCLWMWHSARGWLRSAALVSFVLLSFPRWIQKLVIYCSPWEDWHGAVDLQVWHHGLWWAAVPLVLVTSLGARHKLLWLVSGLYSPQYSCISMSQAEGASWGQQCQVVAAGNPL